MTNITRSASKSTSKEIFVPKGAIAFFILFLGLLALIWISVYFTMVKWQ